MKFYDREKEIEPLKQIEENSTDFAQMTLLIGRRRIGKTTLLKNTFASSSTFLKINCIPKIPSKSQKISVKNY